LGPGPEITVDGRPIEAAELLDGDRLRTGPYEFRLHIRVTPEGPGAEEAADIKPRVARPQRLIQGTPAALVRALLADVRTRIAAAPKPPAGLPAAAESRDAA
jgi:hypothetical protein